MGFAYAWPCVYDHTCWSCQKYNPCDNKKWLLLKCNYLVIIYLLFCYFFHAFAISKFLETHWTYSHVFQSPVADSANFVSTLKHTGFHRADTALNHQICFHASHFQCIIVPQTEIKRLTLRTTLLIWRVRSPSSGVSAPVWQRHRGVG